MTAIGTTETDGIIFFGRDRDLAAAMRKPARTARQGGGRPVGTGAGMVATAALLGACTSDHDGGFFGAPGSVSGRVVKDYAAGADVFADSNRNGVRDAGEAGATTTVDGQFVIAGQAGALTATGGVDTGNGVSLADVTLMAPAGSTVITPLTTLMVAGATDAEIKAAFGLANGLDLTRFDAVAAFTAGDADAAAVLAAGQAATISIRALAALNGESFLDSAARLAGALTGAALDLGDKTTIAGLLGGLDASLADHAATLLAAVNIAVFDRTADPLADGMQAASLIGQTLLLADLAQLAGRPTDELWSQLAARYSDSALDTLIAATTSALPAAPNGAVVAGVDLLQTAMGRPLDVDTATLLANDVSLDGDALQVTGVDLAATEAAKLAVTFDDTTGIITVTPLDGFSGLASFTYQGLDAQNNAFEGVVLVEVGSALIVDGPGDQVLTGDDRRNVLISEAGNDALSGRGDADRIISLDGDDTLDGGAGDDLVAAAGADGGTVVMRGGSGADSFILAPRAADAALDVLATVLDFAKGEDHLDLSALRAADGTRLKIADILAHATDVAGDSVIDLSGFVTAADQPVGGTMTLIGVETASLDAADFVLANGVEWQAGIEDLLTPVAP